ncbi:recombinase family protein [uncultured Prevotella sp.]|uniref:recombinase family protein n=1 Tax=uncultured Prevotella sp. TaxID=159272 RepID=UPI0027E3A7BF|nr:recombinase family protein [uncultured Prevotella sp.]
MIYGYLRVSSDEQDVNSQKHGVVKFAEEHNMPIDKFITDEGVSGGKDPDKRNLGPLLKLINEGDVIICSEISRLGRDLYMVMDILHFCMERKAVIYTVKDKFVLGDDIQSKVLAFAFGLSAEIERQMIRQRTKEGLRLRVKMGVLVGRPLGISVEEPLALDEKQKALLIEQYKWGVPERRLAENFNVDRNTIARWLHRWGIKPSKFIERQEKAKKTESAAYEYGKQQAIGIDRDKLRVLINSDLTLPQIAEAFPEYTYEQIYGTVLVDKELNPLYRKHGQKKVKKVK